MAMTDTAHLSWKRRPKFGFSDTAVELEVALRELRQGRERQQPPPPPAQETKK